MYLLEECDGWGTQKLKIWEKLKNLVFYKYIYSKYWKNCYQQLLGGVAYFFNYDLNISESTPNFWPWLFLCKPFLNMCLNFLSYN